VSELAVVLVVLGVLGLVNLVLTLGLVRRVHAQSALLRMSIEGIENPRPIMLEAGAHVGPFAAATTGGDPVEHADLRGPTLVGFLSASCPACAESLPSFVARARAVPGGRERVLAVVVGDDEATGELRERLAPVARVVVEHTAGPVARAFGVDGFPAFALLADDRVVASHFALDRVPEAVP
jgi:peroxiredoxin